MKKKSAAKKEASNGFRGKAQNKQDTVGKKMYDDLVNIKENDREYCYPFILENRSEDEAVQKRLKIAIQYYNEYIELSEYLSIFFLPVDRFQLAKLAMMNAIHDELLLEAFENPILHEKNGNTMEEVTRINPSIPASSKLMRVINAVMTQIAQTPKARAEMMEKLSNLKPSDLKTNKTMQAANQGLSLKDFMTDGEDNA